MIKNWKLFNENQESEEFRYSESELLDVISDLLDDDLAELTHSESLYYKESGNQPPQLSRETYKLYGSVSCHMFILKFKVETKFIQANSTWYKGVDIFQKIYPILESIKYWCDNQDLTFLFQMEENNLKLLFINDHVNPFWCFLSKGKSCS